MNKELDNYSNVRNKELNNYSLTRTSLWRFAWPRFLWYPPTSAWWNRCTLCRPGTESINLWNELCKDVPESFVASSDLLGWASIHPFLRLETVSPSSWVKVWSNNKFEELLKGCLSFTLKFLHCDSNQISCWGGLTLEKKLGGAKTDTAIVAICRNRGKRLCYNE